MPRNLENRQENDALTAIHQSILRLQKKIDYIFSQIILSSLFDDLLNKFNLKNEGKTMENKSEVGIETLEDMKKKNEYEHPVLLESFVNIENPVIDTEGRIRAKNEPGLNKGLYSRDPVNIIESADIRKVQNDYKRLEDKFDVMMTMFSSMMVEIRELKSTVNAQNKKIDEQARKIDEQSRKIDEQNKEIHELKEENKSLKAELVEVKAALVEVNRKLDESQARNEELRKENKALIEENIRLKTPNPVLLRPHYRLTKKARHSYESEEELKSMTNSDNETAEKNVPLLNVSLLTKNSESREWNPAIGFRDTLSVFTPRSVLKQEKQENELRLAAYNGNTERATEMLNKNESIINGRGMPDSICSLARSFQDKTALMLASQKGNIECVRLLLNNGADVNLLDRDNFTALDYAQQNHFKEIVDCLKQNNAFNGADMVSLNRTKPDLTPKLKAL